MTVKSIIDVDVNDAKFKKFVADFEKYKSALKKSGGAWDKVSKNLADMSANGKDVSDQLKDHEERLKRQKKLYDDIKKTVKGLASEIKTIANDIFDTTRSLLKWVGLGGVFSGLMGAGGLWGLDRLAQSVGDARRSAQGLGITSGQQQAFGLNFGRYVDANSNLSAIAEAKSDYAKRWAFSAMGVNPASKDPAQLAVEMAQKAKQIFDRGDQSEQYAQAHGLLQFYTMEELRRLHATSMKDLQSSAFGYGQDVRQFTLPDKEQKKWQDFATQMDRANMKIKTVLIDGLAPLAGPLNKLSSAVADALATFLKSDNLKKLIPELADGIKRFADYLSDAKFQSDLKTFITDFGLVTDAIVRGLKFLGIIPGGTTDSSGGRNRSGITDPQGAIAGKLYGSKQGYAGITGYLKSKGFSTNAAFGVTSNLQLESGFNPFAKGDYNYKTHHYDAYGLAQWHADRQAEYAKLFGHTMQSVTDPKVALKEQLDFVVYELTHQFKKAGRDIQNSQSAYEAGYRTSMQYERPAGGAVTAAARGANAELHVTVNNNTGGNANVQANQAKAY